MRRLTLALAIIAATLTTTRPAAAESCTIPDGTYRKVTTFGCASIGYAASGGRWLGYLQSTDSGTVSMDRRWSGLWVLMATDTVGGGATRVDQAGPDSTSVRIRKGPVSSALTIARI